MNHSRDTTELLKLLDALWNEESSDEQLAHLQELLRDDPAAQRTYLDYLDLHLGLKQILAVESGGAIPEDELQLPTPAQHHNGQRRFAARWILAATLLVVASAIGIKMFLVRPTSPAVQVAGSLTEVSGSVRVFATSGTMRVATIGTKFVMGERVETLGPGALAEMTFEDGTRLALLNDASVTWEADDRKRIVLHRGVVSANVAHQAAGRSMLLATPGATIEVLGTRFALAATMERTVLNVAEGRVRLTRDADGQVVEVAEGQAVVSNGKDALTVRDSVGPSDNWEMDFENGLPQNWTGEFATEHLPPGSRGAIQTVGDKGSDPLVYVLASDEQWVEGMFAVHEDSHLHITMKMDHPNWLNVFFSARGSDATNPTWALFNFNEVPFWPPKPGQWQTITIPLAKFRRKRDGVFHHDPPTSGEVVYSLSISSTEPDRGLVVDRMWVTRGGSGEVQAVVLP